MFKQDIKPCGILDTLTFILNTISGAFNWLLVMIVYLFFVLDTI